MIRHSTLVSVAVTTLLLAGCAGMAANSPGVAPLTPTQRFTLQVEPGVDRIALAVHDQGVSANQQSALVDLANRFAVAGAPVLRIEAPSGEDAVSSDMAWRIKTVFERIGVPSHQVQVVAYAAPDPRAPVLVGFETLQAHVPRCGTHWTNLTRSAGNQPGANFGCAVTANLAAQIDDPRDILGPRAMTSSDAGRRAVVFDAYRKGTATSSAPEPLVANQRVSQAVQ